VIRVAKWLAALAILVLVLGQILLPRIAASRISSRIGRYGKVDSVHVTAWPAIKLLWGHADSATVHASNLRLSPAQTAYLLWEGRGLGRIDVSASSAQEGPLRLSAVKLHKHGERLQAHALLSQAQVKAALPAGFDVQLLGSRRGQVEVRASGGLFGIGASVNAVAEANGGRLVVHPRGQLVEGLQLTLFSEAHVHVEGVGARAVRVSRGVPGYLVSISASLR
jgi:hypothetical protein